MEWIGEGLKAPVASLALVAVTAVFVFLTSLVGLGWKVVPMLLARKTSNGDTATKLAAVGVSRNEFSDLFGRVGKVEARQAALENRWEAHMRDSAAQTEELTKVRVQVAALGEKVDATREKVDDYCDRIDRMDGKLDRLLERGGKA